MKSSDRDGRLIEILRAGDPASGEALDAESTARMRRRILREREGSPRRSISGAFLWGTASVAVLLAALALLGETVRLPREETTVVAPDAAVARTSDERQPREIHFVTEGGTRVIWTLDPDFDIQ